MTGKYNDGNFPEGSRLTTYEMSKMLVGKYFGEHNKEKTVKLLQSLG